MTGSAAITSLGALCGAATGDTPRTLAEWVRMYRRLRRREYPTEEAFQRRMRTLFKVSSFVRHKGWQAEDLAAALETVRHEPVPELPTQELRPVAEPQTAAKQLTPDELAAKRQEEAQIGIQGYLAMSEPPKCGRCGRVVARCAKDAAGVVCHACTLYLADLHAKGFKPRRRNVRHCPTCKTTLDSGRRYCDPCARKRKREADRRAQRKRREKGRQNPPHLA